MVQLADISIDDVHAAARRLSGVAVHTPLLAMRDEREIWLKPEVLQPVGSFKIRGAFNALASRVEQGDLKEASTLSAGNMSQGVAWSARQFGIAATAIMPEGAPASKIDATRAYGADIEFIPREEVFRAMNDGRYNDRLGFIHPFDDPDVVAGHGTIGLEIVNDLSEVDSIVVPIGSGGLLIGIAVAAKSLRPDVKVIGVQPEGASGFVASFQRGSPVESGDGTFVDGAGSRFVMESMFDALLECCDECIAVGDDQTREAIRRLADGNKLIAEGAGALSVAAAMQLDVRERGRTVCVVSGGSIDPALLAEIIAGDQDTA
ncbi:MAG: threonine ammonia-lyase [Chloroflexota bacterium]